MSNMTKILLLDSSSLIYRAFYAMSTTNLTDAEGRHTGAVYGYLNMLLKLIADLKPTHIIAAFDMSAPTFRHLAYDGYKAKRKPMPDELKEQLPILREVLTSIGVKIIEKQGYEADDIIGTIAKHFDVETCIITGDKDSLQLIDNNTFVYRTIKGVTDLVRYDEKTLLEKENFKPYQIVEYKAIAGDMSDNIPGCPGIGDKGARDLLEKFDNVENIYENISDIKPAISKKLIDNKNIVEMSRWLATINCDVPININLDENVFTFNLDEILATLKKYNFNTIISRIIKEFGGAYQEKEIEKIEIKNEEISFLELKKLLKTEKRDIAVHYNEDITVSFDGLTEYKVVIPKTLFDFDSDGDTKEVVSYIFSLPNKKILFDAKKYFYLLNGENIDDNKFEDVQIMSYLYNSSEPCLELESVAKSFELNCNNVGAALLKNIYDRLLPLLKEYSLEDLYFNIEKPLVKVLYSMETAGLKVNIATLEKLKEKLDFDIKNLQNEIYKIAGCEFNINSPQQMSSLLYDKLGIPKKSKSKSVSADILETIDHPIIPYILQYRHKQKLLSTYVDGLKPLIDKNTNMVHTSFNQCLTVTGRLSSSDPNLQNIPVRDEEGREIRKIFEAKDQSVLISADYSQIELRLLAHFSEDENLINAYKNGHDIHRETAARILNIPIEEVTPIQRSQAKAVNFGIIYGISSFGLSKNVGISVSEAKAFQTKYFEMYPKVYEYMENNVKIAYEKGYISTLMGRIRRLPELKSANYNLRSFGERCAKNMPLQGTASDIIKIAMLKVFKAIQDRGLKARVILQVHDELIVDTPLNEIDEVKSILKNEMESAVLLSVPLIVEIGEGKTWYEAK